MRKVSPKVIVKELESLRQSLRAVDRSLRRLVPVLHLGVVQNGSPAKNGGRRMPRLSAKGRASLVLQGRYMGYVRQLKPRQKAQVRKIKVAKGVRAAIAKARELLSSEEVMGIPSRPGIALS